MKKLLFIALFLIGAAGVNFAQSTFDKAEIELYQSIYGMEKKAVLQNFLKIEDSKTEAFWTLYDAYELQRTEIGKQWISLLYQYVESHDNITDEELKAAMSSSMKTRDKMDKLQKSYFKKISKSVGLKTASQFYQLENYFESLLNIMIVESLPYINEDHIK
ncbi:hypothetical protein [Saccharicrinis aurantiacus]|uniref:hypothetical protein n=1 Tax=Saccharicrinis aurantiacus TaxID=1849719 RepID=UPI00095030D2|nr:hypothetical protein [Saccharicrinis aurantiacus]